MHKIISTPHLQGPRQAGPAGHAPRPVLPQTPSEDPPKLDEETYLATKKKAVEFFQHSRSHNGAKKVWPQVGDAINGAVIFHSLEFKMAFWKHHENTNAAAASTTNSTPQAKRKKPDPSQQEITRYFGTPHQAEVAPEVTEREQLNTLIDLQKNLNERLEKLITPRTPGTEQQEKAKQKQQEFLEAELAKSQEQINSILSKLQ